MAFALLAGSIGEVAELGTLASEFVEGATGSELAGGASRGAVIGGVGTTFEGATKTLVDKIFGENSYDNFTNELNKASELGKQVFEGDFTRGFNKNKELDTLTGQSHRVDLQKCENFNENQNFSEKNEKIENLAEDLAKFTNLLGNEVAKESSQGFEPSIMEQGLRTIIDNNPSLSYLVVPFIGKLSKIVIPTDNDFKTIASIYNGQFQSEQYETEDAYNMLDETGALMSYKKSFAPKNPVPTIWGVYTGINSRNNSLSEPSMILANGELKRSYLDLCSFCHDLDYHNRGNFDYLSDMKYLARVVQGKKRGEFVFENEEETADIAVSYFSTIGEIARQVLGTPQMTMQDRGLIQGKLDEEENLPYGTIIEEIIPSVSVEDQQMFKEIYEEKLKKQAETNSIVSKNSNARILTLFDNILVELD